MMPASPKDLPSTAVAGLAQLLDASGRPIYAVGDDRRIVYCNASLASWLGTERSQIVGRFVEYHSVPAETTESSHKPAKLLTDLCPPPVALAGKQCSGTVATVGRDGRLIHRRADFLPLVDSEADAAAGVLVLLASVDLLPHELSAEVAEEATPDELHRAIRRFRQTQSEGYAIESLLGTSSVIEKVRAQVAAAATGRASVLVRGRRGSGRAHVAPRFTIIPRGRPIGCYRSIAKRQPRTFCGVCWIPYATRAAAIGGRLAASESRPIVSFDSAAFTRRG